MLWSAWADALGFISERVGSQYLEKRVGSTTLATTVEWTRRVGGRFGVEMVLPAGTYSDDTQLRLASSRAISPRGFDVEAFAKVEMVVWPSYALGGGRASKAAAANLAKPSVPWFGNFYDGYLAAGGNGVAMRIQPHVWAAPDPTANPGYLVDLIKDAVVTHGHPRAIVGAVLHAVSLGQVVATGQPVGVQHWADILGRTAAAASLLACDDNLTAVWLPYWENATGVDFKTAWSEALAECADGLEAIRPAVGQLAKSSSSRDYDVIIKTLDLRNPDNVGSGTATAVAALAVACALPNDPEAASRLAANALGTDTDTIGTMVGALVGAAADAEPQHPLQDIDYLRREAVRLSDIASGRAAAAFNYADLLTWASPKTQVDCVGLVQGRFALAGLAYLQPDQDVSAGTSKTTTWEWAVSDFGQSVLIKRRTEPKELPGSQRPSAERYSTVSPTPPDRADGSPGRGHAWEQNELVEMPAESSRPSEREQAARSEVGVDVDTILRWLLRQGVDDASIGFATRRIAESGTIEQTVAFGVALRGMVRKKGIK
jgi:ADP-ribosylglycohydrolase